MSEGKKTYFASDFHLGLAAGTNPREREERVVAWLRQASADAHTIYLLGDIFDFWWEYKKVVPKGFTRFLGMLSHLTDSGIAVHLFTGNHDLWMKSYLEEECGVTIHHEPLLVTIGESCSTWPTERAWVPGAKDSGYFFHCFTAGYCRGPIQQSIHG